MARFGRIEIFIGKIHPQGATLLPLGPGGVIGHFRKVPGAHPRAPLSERGGKGGQAGGEGVGLFPVREVPGGGDRAPLIVLYAVLPVLIKIMAIALIWSFPLTARRQRIIRRWLSRPRTVATLSEPSFVATKKKSLEIFQREVRR